MKKVLIVIGILFFLLILYVCHPRWTSKIDGGISEYKIVKINGTKLHMTIRGEDKDSPVMLYVHGGPSIPDFSYIKKYQENLEKDFIVVNYAERGAGNSYSFFEDYSDMNIDTHVEDLISLTKYIKDYLNKDKIILVGHSWGSYIGMIAANKNPDDYISFVGIGQVTDSIKSEQDTYNIIMKLLEEDNDINGMNFLESIKSDIDEGMYVPRTYLYRYGYDGRDISIGQDLRDSFYHSREANLLDYYKYIKGVEFSDVLWDQVIENPLVDIVTSMDIPIYFVMGKYDGVCSTRLAKEYFDKIDAKDKEFVLFENSSHYPHIEEEELFYEFMYNTFIK